MDRLRAMETFTRVVEAGSFRRAAETLRILPSTVTKTIQDLEAHLDVQLLKRSTRALSLTDAGLRFYDSCKAILREVEASEALVARHAGTLRGTLRVGMTPSLACRLILPELPRFTARHPDIAIDLHLSDAVVDLIQHGIDCVVRVGVSPPSSLILRPLGTFRWYVCASPGYLERHGVPSDIEALRDHLAVGYADGRTGRPIDWTFRDGDRLLAMPMAARVTVNDTDAYVAAGVAGLGLIRVASYMVRDHLASGRLTRVLSHVETPAQPLSILYPPSRHLSPVVRAFIDWCVEVVGREAEAW